MFFEGESCFFKKYILRDQMRLAILAYLCGRFTELYAFFLQNLLRIRIRIHFGWLDQDPHWEYESGSRRAKMTHNREENSSTEVLDVLFRGMKTSPVA